MRGNYRLSTLGNVKHSRNSVFPTHKKQNFHNIQRHSAEKTFTMEFSTSVMTHFNVLYGEKSLITCTAVPLIFYQS